jgi:SEC-C motif domain protein
MTRSQSPAFEEGLLPLPGTPEHWIWAFTCPEPKCPCRTVVVVSTTLGDRDCVRERGLSVAEAWRGRGHYALAASKLKDVVTFTVDLDTLEVVPLAKNGRLESSELPEAKAIADRLDDELLDAMARLWHRGKGAPPSSVRSAGTDRIEIEGFRPGDWVIWDDAQGSLRSDSYVFGERVFDAIELYCVDAGCDCREVIVDFSPILPRGAPHPGHVEIDGALATLRPTHERHRDRLRELWNAYCRRHRDHQERFARRCTSMHQLAGRIVAAPKPRANRNEPCPCGSGRKYKKCCGAA